MKEVTESHDYLDNDEVGHIGNHEELHLQVMEEVICVSVVPNICVMSKDELILSNRLKLNDICKYHEKYTGPYITYQPQYFYD